MATLAQMATFHEAELQRHCRVCAKPFSTNEYQHPCSENKDILEVLGINIAQDTPEVHPTMFCHLCYSKAQRSKKKWVNSSLEVHEWTKHPHSKDAICETCEFFMRQKKGGRPTRASKNRGRPKHDSNRYIAEAIRSNAPPNWRVSEPLELSRFLPPAANVSLQDMHCAFCMCIANQAVTTPCRRIVCAKCISSYIRDSKESCLLQCTALLATHHTQSVPLPTHQPQRSH